ncbi:MAG: Ppx/GppA family phosphatase [Actinomycetota bacterium]|nr:Ppx/GppA family phosphatase [Actinomycetota bacterium]
MRIAAVDCGTNSTRLLVREDRHPRPLARRMHITRLGEGVDARRRLDPAAIERTVAVLRDYRAVMDDLGVASFRATATSAARDAMNREEFFDAAAEALGAPPELLGGAEEGRLSFLGATAELDRAEGPFLVVDIGGGSTEFVVGTQAPSGVASIDVGCVRLTEKFLRSDPPTPEELSQAISVVRAHLDDVKRELPEAKEARCLVGLAGTVTTIAAVEIGLQEYDAERIHHFVLTRAAAEDVFRTLATESRSDRLHNPGLEAARADVIVGGAAILVTVMRHFGFDELLVSEADILDGLVMSQLPAAGAEAR